MFIWGFIVGAIVGGCIGISEDHYGRIKRQD